MPECWPGREEREIVDFATVEQEASPRSLAPIESLPGASRRARGVHDGPARARGKRGGTPEEITR